MKWAYRTFSRIALPEQAQLAYILGLPFDEPLALGQEVFLTPADGAATFSLMDKAVLVLEEYKGCARLWQRT
jgi:hypothetical protein